MKIKMTLFKKVFLIICLSMVMMECLHIYIDYKDEVKEKKQEIELLNRWDNNIYSIQSLYLEYKDINNPDFLKKIQDLERVGENNTLILDLDLNIVNDNNYWQDLQAEQSHLIFSDYNKEHGFIHFKNTTSDFYYKVKKVIYNYVKNNKEKCEIIIDSNYIDQDKVSWEEIQYLSINNEIIINKDNNILKKKMYLDNFTCTYFFTHFKNEKDGYEIKEDLNVANQLFIEKIREEIAEAGHIDEYLLYNNQYKTIIVDNHIYCHIMEKLGDQGYVIGYDKMLNQIDYIKYDIIDSRIPIYILLLVFIIFVSTFLTKMITRRIYIINDVTKRIASNELDVKLKENPDDELGEMSKNINIMVDRLKYTIQQLNQEIERVEELESLRKDFINQFTHEMKTPLGIINGYSELIEESDNEEEKEKYLSIINRETERINMLIQSMLKLSRLEAGKVELNREKLDLEDIIIEVVDEYEVLLMKKNIKVEVDIRDKAINGDRNQIITVLRNFISNAIKHTETKIVITADRGIRVYNEGKHIEEERLESIWYTFVTHDKSGSGLGLAICRSILELHGYEYGVLNQENGVEFYFYK